LDVVLQAALVGLIQGLTEFIPISSSAHLELVPWIAGWRSGGLVGSLAFDVFLHLGTLVALLAYFARDWVRYVGAWWASVRERRIGPDPDRRLAWLLIAATIPAALIGFTLEGVIEDSLHGDSDAARLAIAGFLVIGAVGLWLADRLGRRDRDVADITAPAAITIGLSQALALLPGISRSGATITAGLALGLSREAAARFSFLLATPITLGAGLYGSRRLLTESHTGTEWLAIAVGFALSAVAGLLAIRFLLAWLRSRSVAVFSLYRIGLALLVVVLVLVR
jgi:undecaprenyl-diphosphatase